MDRDYLYFHFANLGLVILALLSVEKVANPWVILVLIPGSIVGFVLSWQIRDSRPPHIDTFIGMLSLASVIVILSRFYDTQVSFENLLTIFSTALAWLCLFQSFGISTGKSYAVLQFISICLMISSVSLALEKETVYVVYLAIFLLVLVFTLRLGLMCEHKRKGSFIIGNREYIMGLWQQIKVAAIMFSIVLMLSAFIYPLVPRFNNLSLTWIPSTLLGLPEQIPLLKLLTSADKNLKDDKRIKKEQIVDDDTKKRETRGDVYREVAKEKEGGGGPQSTERFQAKEFNKNIDMFKIKSLQIMADRLVVPLDQEARLAAELRMEDGSILSATSIVDWKVVGTAKVSIDKHGRLTPKEAGELQISATYMGNFSNDLNIKIRRPLVAVKKKTFLFYIFAILIWAVAAVFLGFSVWIFVKARRLKEMYAGNPKEFVKEVYDALCKAFKIYGTPRFDYMAYREFYNLARSIVSARPEPMHAMTENILEVRFSNHEITTQHSHETIRLFHDVKEVIMEKDEVGAFWKGVLFRLCVLDVLLLPTQFSKS